MKQKISPPPPQFKAVFHFFYYIYFLRAFPCFFAQSGELISLSSAIESQLTQGQKDFQATHA